MTACLLSLLLLGPLAAAEDPLRGLFDPGRDGRDGRDTVFLKPDAAFPLSAETDPSGASVTLRWQIAPGYYLYRDRFRVTQGGQELALDLPEGIRKQDLVFGAVQVYKQVAAVTVPLAAHGDLDAHYQGCKEDSICYPPSAKRFVRAALGPGAGPLRGIDLPPGEDPAAGAPDPGGSAAAAAAAAPGPGSPGAPPLLPEHRRITEALASGRVLTVLLGFLGFGLLLSLTPCVYPMIPILVGMLARRGETISGRQGFLLSLSFVLAMALSYAVFGVIAGSLRLNLQAAAQAPWLIGLFSAVFVLLALSTFGAFSLHTPNALQTRFRRLIEQQRDTTLRGSALMGVLSALIVGPCVTPPLLGALLYISQTGNAALGGAALFMLGAGFGIPLLIVGASAGQLLPRAGQWMNGVRQFFGILLLAVAIWLLERILADRVTALLWACLLIVGAVLLGAMDRLPAAAGGWTRLRSGVGLLVLCYGAVMLLGASSGGGNLLQPLRAWHSPAANTSAQPFQRIAGEAALEQALEQARRRGQPLVLDFYADWCAVCHQMARTTFADSTVQALLRRTVAVQLDVTRDNAGNRALLQRFDLFGPPGLVFFAGNGEELRDWLLAGSVDAGTLRRYLRALLGDGESAAAGKTL